MESCDPLPSASSIRIKEVFGIFVASPDDIEFRTGTTTGRSLVLSDPERRGLLGPIIGRILSLDEARDRPWNDAESEVLRELIPQLEESGVIECDGQAKLLNEGRGAFIPLLQKPITDARIAIVGHGVLGEAVRRFLTGMPCASLTMVESSSVAKAGIAQAVDIVGQLPNSSGMTSQTQLARPTTESGWSGALAGHDWVIAAQDSFEPEELAALNKAALHLGVPWSLVCFDGYEGWVGPTFLPGQTACFTCFRRRLFAGASEPKHIFTEPGIKVYRVPAPWLVGPEAGAWVSLIASMFAHEVVAVMNGRGFTINNLLVVHRLNLTFQREPVLRLPRCPDCAPRSNAPRLNVFSHLLTTRTSR